MLACSEPVVVGTLVARGKALGVLTYKQVLGRMIEVSPLTAVRVELFESTCEREDGFV